jgi:dipeptidyl aminopeptidase/acylaminoacyl peptidase
MTIFRQYAAVWGAAALVFCTPLRAQPPAAAPAPAAATPPPVAAPLGLGPVPIDALARPPYLSSPMLSPDGNRIAAELTLEDKKWIGIWDVSAGPGTQPRLYRQQSFDVRWLRWAGPSRLLVGIQVVRRYAGIDVPVTRIIALDVTSWRGLALQTGEGVVGDDVIFVDPAGTYALVTTQATADQYPDVRRIDLATGASTVVQRARAGIWDWFADRGGVVRAGVDTTDNRIRLYYRAGPGEELRRIDTRRYPQDGSVIEMIRFVQNTDRGIVVTNAVTGRFAVYDYDFATDTRGDAVFEHPQADVTSFIMGPDGRVDGVAFEDDRRRFHWINPELQRLQATIDRALPGKINWITGRSDDGMRVLIWSSAADDSGTYYLFDRRARRIEPFANPYDQVAEHRLAPVRPVTYKSRDGTDIPGYLTLPPGRPERGLPLILMPHGGPFARDSWEFDPWVQFLASRGYAVLQANFRGSTGFGRAYVERGFGQWGSGMIDDLEDGVDWLAGQGMIDVRRVCVMGASYGGYVALWAPIRHPDRYRCAISFAGISDLRAMLRYDNRQFAAPRYSREWRRRVQGEERTDLDAISPLRQAERIRIPLLIGHGARDTNVPVAQSRNLVRALERSAAPMESVFYPEAGHGFARAQDQADFLRRVEAFLARHNPADAAPAPAPVAAPR